MRKTKHLRQTIKVKFIPFMQAKGFVVDLRQMPFFMVFRKITHNRIYVCDIQWEKSGRPYFVLNFGSCGPYGVISQGNKIIPEDIYTSISTDRGRLTAKAGPFISSWFRQDYPLLQRLLMKAHPKSAEEVVTQLMTYFTEVEEYWSKGIIGEHIRIMPNLSEDRLKDIPSP